MQPSFDTHSAVKELISIGIKEAHAEKFVKIFVKSRKPDLSNLATKADMVIVKADIAAVKADMVVVKADIAAVKGDIAATKGDIAAVKADISILEAKTISEIEKAKNDMFKAMVALQIISFGATAALLRYFIL